MKEYTEDRTDDARAELESLHPADIAELYQNLDIDEAEYLYRLLDPETAADVLMELDEDERLKLLEAMTPEKIAQQIDHLDTDDAVDLIQQLDEDDRDEILSHIDDVEQAGDIIDLLKYDEDTAGGLMGTEMLVANENWSMPETIKQLRLQAEDMDEIYYVYVVDDDNKLKGILPLKELITHPSVSKIKHVMENEPVAVKVDTPIDEVALEIEKYDLVAIPVVDSIGRLLGRITVDDVMDEVRESSERDYQLASGLSSDVDAEDTIFKQVKAFIPIIGGTGGNVGVQSSAIVVQSLANGTLELKQFSRQLGKEVLVGLLNGTIIAAVVFLYNLIMLPGDFAVTISVAVSLFIVTMFATILGTVVPLTLERLHINPALATGPFIQISNDLVGLMIYVWVSTYFLSVFS